MAIIAHFLHYGEAFSILFGGNIYLLFTFVYKVLVDLFGQIFFHILLLLGPSRMN